MQRLGLALSGGGFRATLYHLGVVRFLRDAEILPKITHITTVSGGSILGAHLALNWKKYTGSPEEFEEVAEEVLQFIRLDVRNRIVRRFPFAGAINRGRQLLRLPKSRRLSRPGLLEKHYEQFLYGDIALSQLPEHPQLHILATDLSEGCLGSFNRHGLLLQRRVPGRRDQFDRVHLGLATVPIAVAASSAFPGFFPPMEITGWDVGADEGEFKRHAFTDGGVYDNLGLRMFRCLEQSWARDAVPLQKEDFLELEDCTQALQSASSLPEDTPLRRLRELLDAHVPKVQALGRQADMSDNWDGEMIGGLWDVIRSERLYRDSSFENVELADATAQSLLNFVTESGREPELNDRLWLNRQIVESALRQVIGKPCLRMSRKEFDGILVSDAGGKFKVARDGRSGGLIRTALRASDILMDRVWQLESEVFENAQGIKCVSIFDVVEPSQDPTAPHPEVQRQAAKSRTDLDRFSDLEISALVQHGYCVARKTFRIETEFLKTEIPDGPPWDPLGRQESQDRLAPPVRSRLSDADVALPIARKLRNSSKRRIWSTLFSFRDWPSYVWMAVVLCLAIGVPYGLYNIHQTTERQRMVIAAVAEMSPDYRKILDLMKYGPTTQIEAMPYEDVAAMESPDFTGLAVLVDTRIFDLRGWADSTGRTPPSSHTRLRVGRKSESVDNAQLRIQRETADERVSISCTTQGLNPSLSRMRTADGTYLWELGLDFSDVPVGGQTQVNIESILSADVASETPHGGRFNFAVGTQTDLLEVWILMPEGRKYESLEVTGYSTEDSELSQVVVPHSLVEAPYGSVVTFRMFDPETYHYECRWKWSDAAE